MTVAAHPSLDTLTAYARGELPAPELAGVAEHIGGCAGCCAALGRLLHGSPAGSAPTGPLVPDDQVQTPVGPPAAAPVPPDLADHPRYKVLSELGAGGMGVVYKAEHRIMGRVVALKVMAPHLTAKAGSADRFRKEVRAAARLGHPNIVTAHDADEAGGLHFLVMEYVDGVSLERLVAKRGPLPVTAACALARQAALGLGHAHARGMVHRDIKPQNLMVTRRGHLKVMDFGLARFVRDGVEAEAGPPGRLPFGAGKPVADPLTNPNLLMGTPDYLSPEQARNSAAVDARSDLYSLGCTLYFLLTGAAPFARASSLIDKLLAHTEEPPPPVREVRPDVPEGLAALLWRLLAKNPDDRPAGAAEVAAALAPYLRAEGPEGDRGEVELVAEAAPAPKTGRIPAPATDVVDRGTVPTGPTLAETPKPRPRKKKAARRRRRGGWWAWAAAAAAVAVAAAAVVAGGWRKAADPAAADPPRAAAPAPPPRPDTAPPKKAGPDPAARARDLLPVLFVVPSDGLNGPDYFPVRDRVAKAGVRVATASGAGGSAGLAAPHDDGAKSVRVDLRLADADAGRYSAVVFCGHRTDEYVVPGLKGYGPPTRQLLADLRATGKPVAAIGGGQRVLATHGALKGRSAARCEPLLSNYPGLAFAGVTWVDKPVVVDGRVVTAAGAAHADAFADALVKLLTAE
ncbi:MAG: hypothetical protein C0501_17970 [Isosphaera sp.]|nr:hypothetical protein [Isosphaera sp.]